eukprot:5842133-Pyramimonas_sp.AAC.1
MGLGLPGGVRVDGVGGSRRVADASAMRPDVESDLIHVDGADASPASSMHRRRIADVSAIHRQR